MRALIIAALVPFCALAQVEYFAPVSGLLTNTNGLGGSYISFRQGALLNEWSVGQSNGIMSAVNVLIPTNGISLFSVTNIASNIVASATNSIDGRYQRLSANTNIVSRSVVTVSNAANGWQISATRDSEVAYNFSQTSLSTITGGAAGYIALEIAPTNSTAAALWIEKSRSTGGQNNGLIVGLALDQRDGGPVQCKVPAGYYVRVRSVNVTGTPTWSYNSGWECVE